ncbi:DUF2726 domain-containing protein [Vitreoscilla massiliensis]|uniref:DUF2726 domain-containing protein n=1 Tax=Vitreoscilla massiliensis TaxID=1689272 RepID=A0ABY4E0E0_9NEIS|nr:DUF2726 domain-containing protein [Vitreoscilla massiliensis]UOO89261.1 DUF2726 domain-containing protein [Vitreoscilla massiliensis]
MIKFILIIFALFVLVAILFLIFVATLKNKKDFSTDKAPWPFYSKRPLSRPEQVMYFRLIEALPDFVVLPQVGLSRFLGVKKGNNFGQWFNRINRMSVDFLVCSKDFKIISAIELDDSTHNDENRKIADAKKDKALDSAGVQIIRWQVTNLPDVENIKKLISDSDSMNHKL